MKNRATQAGFSLIELMVAVSIIGILASIAIPNYQSFVDKSRYNRSKAEMAGMSTSISGERITSDMTLYSIINAAGYPSVAYCAACVEGRVVGSDGIVATNLSNPGVLYAWSLLGYNKVPMDPWGRPYFLDPNEGESGPADCRHDLIYSAGKNFIVESDSSGEQVGGDDAAFYVPFYTTSCISVDPIPAGYDGY